MLIDQPSDKTVRKVKYASWTAVWVAPLATIAAAAIVEVLPASMAQFHSEITLLITAAITGAGTWLAGYYTRERV